MPTNSCLPSTKRVCMRANSLGPGAVLPLLTTTPSLVFVTRDGNFFTRRSRSLVRFQGFEYKEPAGSSTDQNTHQDVIKSNAGWGQSYFADTVHFLPRISVDRQASFLLLPPTRHQLKFNSCLTISSQSTVRPLLGRQGPYSQRTQRPMIDGQPWRLLSQSPVA